MKPSPSRIMAIAALSLLDPALRARQDGVVMAKDLPRGPSKSIAPPPRYRDVSCSDSSIQPPGPRPARDVAALSAAEVKRARKAAARLKAMKP